MLINQDSLFFSLSSKIYNQLNTKVVFLKKILKIPEETNLLYLSIPSVSVNHVFGITFGRIAKFLKE